MNFLSKKESLNNAHIWLSIPALIIAAGIILRFVIRSSTSLWEDEVIAATHATQSLLNVFINPLVNDIHPPLYFLELHVWSLFGQSDHWLIANSIVLGIAAIISLFIVMRKISDTERAFFITAVFCVLPVSVWMSGEVRMYAFLSILFIWMYHFTYRVFALADRRLWVRIAPILLAIGIIYTHAIGLIAVFFFGIYAASCLIARKVPPRAWLKWFFIFGCAGLAAIPMLLIAVFHKTDMPSLTGLQDILSWMASVVTGEGYKFVLWLKAAGLITYCIVVIAGTVVPRTRQITFCFLIVPLILCIIVGIATRPIFKTNFFSNFYSPFLAIVIGDLMLTAPLNKILRIILLISVCVALLAMAVANRTALNATNTYYKGAADLISRDRKSGDIVWVPQTDIFWGMAWYLAGPDWGSPIVVNAPLRPQSRWWKLFDFLGPDLVKKLQLIPATQTITTKDGLPIMMSATSQSQAEQAKRVWLVIYPRDDLPVGMRTDAIGPLHQSNAYSLPPIRLYLLVHP